MSNFTETAHIKWLPKKWKWVTTEELRFYTNVFDKRKTIIVPVWFEFDWASVPRFLWWLYPPAEPQTINAACIHDYLFKTKQFSLWKSDLIFLEALQVSGNRFLKRYVMFYGLKLWSWITWYIKPIIERIWQTHDQ